MNIFKFSLQFRINIKYIHMLLDKVQNELPVDSEVWSWCRASLETSQSQVINGIYSLVKYFYHLYRWSVPLIKHIKETPSDWSSSQARWGEGNYFARGKRWRATATERAKNIMKSLHNCNNIKIYRFIFHNYKKSKYYLDIYTSVSMGGLNVCSVFLYELLLMSHF